MEKEHGKIRGSYSPRDFDRHGTLVSSIVSGNFVKDVSSLGYFKGTSKGVVFLTKIVVYKVVWSNRIVGSDVVTAIDQTIVVGVNVINLFLFRKH